MLKHALSAVTALVILGGVSFAAPGARGGYSEAQLTQVQTATGVVRDAVGPIIGAGVVVKGTTTGVVTDVDGSFSLPAIQKGTVLVISCIGYVTREVVWNGEPLDIVLEEDSEMIEETVVIGFGVQKKTDVTGAVAQVKMDEVLGDRPVINAAAALQGAIPGLMVSGASGPGQNKTLNIRGDLSINGGSPLVLIDNVEGSISQLNPDDIESVTVLKDAASAAIYGARAAGGVVLITTKNPKSNERFNLTYGFSQGWETSVNRPEQAPLLTFIDAYREAGFSNQFYAGNGDVDTWVELINQYRAGQLSDVAPNGIYLHSDGRTYYLKESNVQGSILGNGSLSNHNISVSGGTDRVRFRMSANYSREDGPLITSKDLFVRKAINSSISADVTNWLTQEVSMFYTQRERTDFYNILRDTYAVRIGSWWPVDGYMPGKILGLEEDYIMDTPKNSLLAAPVSHTNYSIPRTQIRSILKPMKNWTITGEYTYDQTNYNYKAYQTPYSAVDAQLSIKWAPTDPTKDTYTISNQVVKYNALNIYSNYAVDFGKHHFTAMAGFNQESSFSQTVTPSIKGQSVPTVPSFGGGTDEKNIAESYSEWRIRGGFGRITYNFDDRYFLSLSGRYDGSSKFPKQNRFGFFPSVSAGWRVAQESFMAWSRSWLNELKPRVSYGSIGNQAISPYGFVSQMTIGQSTTWLTDGDKVTVIGVPGLVRGNYTWETVTTLNVGVDFRLFNNRLQGSYEWYRRMTSGMLAAGVELPSTVGAAAPLQNVADMRTDGWELSLNWQDVIGDWSYRFGFNVYDHMSTITKFDNATKNLNNWYEGENFNNIWGFISDGYYTIDDFDRDLARVDTWVLKEGVVSIQGVNVRPGDMKFKDLNDDGEITFGAGTLDDPGDRKIIGNSTSRYQFGANAGVSWKGFDLDVMLQGVGKRDYWIGGHALFAFGGVSGGDAGFQPLYYNQTDYWRAKSYDPESPDYMVAENPNATLFRIYNRQENIGSNTRVSDKYLQSAAYLRIKNVTLGYTFPQRWMKKLSVSQFRVYGSVENLHTFTSLPKGYDPERLSWGYPFYRTCSIGATITF